MKRTVVDTFTYSPPEPHYEVEYLIYYHPEVHGEEWRALQEPDTGEVWTWPNDYEGLAKARATAMAYRKVWKTDARVVRVTENEQD